MAKEAIDFIIVTPAVESTALSGDKRELNHMIDSSEPERMYYMADLHDGLRQHRLVKK